MPRHWMERYPTINVEEANLMNRRPANQNESDFLMLTKPMAHIWCFSCFLIWRGRVSLIDNILSHETVDPNLKKVYIFNALNSIYMNKFFMCYL